MLLQSPTFHCKASPQGKWHEKYKKSTEETSQFLAIMELKLKISAGLDKKCSRLQKKNLQDVCLQQIAFWTSL